MNRVGGNRPIETRATVVENVQTSTDKAGPFKQPTDLNEFSKTLLRQIITEENKTTVTEQIKTRAKAFLEDILDWSDFNTYRISATSKLNEIIKVIPKDASETIQLLESLQELEKYHNKIPLTHTLILQWLGTKDADAQKLFEQSHFQPDQISKDFAAKQAYEVQLRKAANIPKTTWAQWLSMPIKKVITAVADKLNSAARIKADTLLGNATNKIDILLSEDLAARIQTRNNMTTASRTKESYMAWQENNLKVDAPAKQYKPGFSLGIETWFASKVNIAANNGILHAAQTGAFGHILSPVGLISTLNTVDNLLTNIQKPPEDFREIEDIQKEIDVNFKHAAEKLALTLIPSGFNPIKFVWRKLLASTLKTYYLRELGERAYMGSPRATDTFLDPVVPYLQAVKGFDLKTGKFLDLKTKTRRLLAFSRATSQIVDQIGAPVEAEQPKKIGHQIGIPLNRIINRLDWEKPALKSASRAAWIPTIAGWGSTKNTAFNNVIKALSEPKASSILKLLEEGKYEDAINEVKLKHPENATDITEKIRIYSQEENFWDEILTAGYQEVIEWRILPWLSNNRQLGSGQKSILPLMLIKN